MKKLNKS